MYNEYNKRLMVMEGSTDNCLPDRNAINKQAKAEGYKLVGLEIFFDDFQSVWRWTADLAEI